MAIPAGMYLMLIAFGLLPGKWTSCDGLVFLPRHAAESVLTRHKRHNTGSLEEFLKDNLERECMEEKCTFEEAREVFENGERTMEFWTGYSDGDQCQSSPCQNGAECKDAMNAYICWCKVGYSGKNCEIESVRQCDINNGGCSHFCKLDRFRGVVCDCAAGYKLAQDGKSCDPEGDFPCGKLGVSIISALSTRSLQGQDGLGGSNDTVAKPLDLNSTGTHVGPAGGTTSQPPASNETTNPGLDGLPSWAFSPTLPTITAQEASDKRIVGGSEVTPGEIPWQVALVNTYKEVIFCGGSILSDIWVITAAHCLEDQSIDGFVVRVGEHSVHKQESTEQNHRVAEQHLHFLYNASNSKYNHDVALLRLHTPIAFSDFALPICYGPKKFTEAALQGGGHSLVSGWGLLRFQGAQSPTLQKLEVPYVSRTECTGSSSQRITPFMFCAGYLHEVKDACQGDSGGPHATQVRDTWFLTGIVSWGEECAKEGKYGVYTHMSYYYPWINHVTGIKQGRLLNKPRP